MNLYHVWIDDTGDYIAVEAGSPDSLKEITKAIKEGYNLCEIFASFKEEAITRAKEAGLQYATPLQLQSLKTKVAILEMEIQELKKDK
jgi:hypothetical protein